MKTARVEAPQAPTASCLSDLAVIEAERCVSVFLVGTDQVVIDRKAEVHGDIDLTANKVTTSKAAGTELLNRIIIAVLDSGSDVRVCDASELPEGCSQVAAI